MAGVASGGAEHEQNHVLPRFMTVEVFTAASTRMADGKYVEMCHQ